MIKMEHETNMWIYINYDCQIQDGGTIIAVEINMNGHWTRKYNSQKWNS